MPKEIKDAVAVELAKKLIKPTEQWEARHHMKFIWSWFRLQGFQPEVRDAAGVLVAKPTEEQIKAAVQACGKQWEAMHNNANIAYASNQAKGFAEAKVCAPARGTEAIVEEFN